jgi:hypothetical protein
VLSLSGYHRRTIAAFIAIEKCWGAPLQRGKTPWSLREYRAIFWEITGER